MTENRSRTVLSFALPMLFFLLLLSVTSAQAQLFSVDPNEVPDLNNGAKVWAQACVRCHNLRQPAELSDYDWKVSMTHMRVRAGLTGKDARDITAFIMASKASSPVSASAFGSNPDTGGGVGMSGEAIYNSSCVGCHGDDGKGTMTGVPDFTKAGGVLSQPADILFKNTRDGLQTPGNSMAMPPRGGDSDLSDDDLKSVLQYIQDRFGG